MLRGETIGKNGWKDESVKDALDLCLACKGCKDDCPVSVDMATYKAEFLSHYYKGRVRPLYAYAFGLIHVWSRLAQIAPSLVNFVNRAPIHQQRRQSSHRHRATAHDALFRDRVVQGLVRQATRRNQGKTRVMLWPDTFNNYFHPAVAKAAVAVLEDAGFQVVLPKRDLCCGRPLYDYGMLDTAQRWLLQILALVRRGN